jgi:hypothetical protein
MSPGICSALSVMHACSTNGSPRSLAYNEKDTFVPLLQPIAIEEQRLTLRTALRLLQGRDWQHLDKTPALTESQLLTAWQTHRDTVLPQWVAHFPGTRPWVWWAYEAPERRTRVDKRKHPYEDGSTPTQWQVLSYGLPRYLQTEDHFTALYESETSYLIRHGLLTPSEKQSSAGYYQSTTVQDDERPAVTVAQVEAWIQGGGQ